MRDKIIEFNKPFYGEAEAENLRHYIIEGRDYTDEVLKKIQDISGAGMVLLTGSASSAMEIYLASGILPVGSEVIVPSFTYPAAANVVLSAGLKPVFADIDSETLVMDMNDIMKRINGNTSCIMPVHYGGASVDMDVLMGLADERKIQVLEDAALSMDAFYRGRHLGTRGNAGVVSFHKTKNLSGEGGGALFIKDIEHAYIWEEMLESGTDRKAFFRGETMAYSWQRPGRGLSMGPLSAAVLSAQLEKVHVIAKGRKHLWELYYRELIGPAGREIIKLPSIPEYNTNNHHVFYILFKDNETREIVRNSLKNHGINGVIHYMPLHSSPYGRKLGYSPDDCPVSEDIAGRLLRLPLHMYLSDDDVKYICKIIRRTID